MLDCVEPRAVSASLPVPRPRHTIEVVESDKTVNQAERPKRCGITQLKDILCELEFL